jgi:hypothetical protein
MFVCVTFIVFKEDATLFSFHFYNVLFFFEEQQKKTGFA